MMMEVCGVTSLMITEVYGAMMELRDATSRLTEVSCYQSYDGDMVLLVI